MHQTKPSLDEMNETRPISARFWQQIPRPFYQSLILTIFRASTETEEHLIRQRRPKSADLPDSFYHQHTSLICEKNDIPQLSFRELSCFLPPCVKGQMPQSAAENTPTGAKCLLASVTDTLLRNLLANIWAVY